MGKVLEARTQDQAVLLQRFLPDAMPVLKPPQYVLRPQNASL